MRTFYVIFLLLCLPLIFPVSIAGASERSPFEASPKQKSLYNYANASKSLRISGLITTEKQGRVILKFKGCPDACVFRKGDGIQLVYRGIIHGFTISDIKTKSLMLKGKNNKTYEVKAR